MQSDITAKRLEILKQTVPQATRFSVLWDSTAPSYRPVLQAAEAARGKLGVQLLTVSVTSVADYDGHSRSWRKAASTAHSSTRPRSPLATIPAIWPNSHLKHRLPTIYGASDNVIAGGLMSYAPDFTDLWRRAAIYIDKVLKGVKPADLPVEQASKYQLIINLKTARALGLTLQPSILARADEVIE